MTTAVDTALQEALAKALAEALAEALANLTNATNMTNATSYSNITLKSISPSPAPATTWFTLTPKFPAGTTRTVFLCYCLGYPILFTVFFAFKYIYQVVPSYLKQRKLFFVMVRATGVLVFIPLVLIWFYMIRWSHFGDMGKNTIFAIVFSFPASFATLAIVYILSKLYHFFGWIRAWRIEEGLTVGESVVYVCVREREFKREFQSQGQGQRESERINPTDESLSHHQPRPQA